MGVFSTDERRFCQAISALSFSNPFLPERVEFEQQALGDAFEARFAQWSAGPEARSNNPNVDEVERRAVDLERTARERVQQGARASDPHEQALLSDLIRFGLYARYGERLHNDVVLSEEKSGKPARVAFYDEYLADAQRAFDIPGVPTLDEEGARELFAFFFQLRRAFRSIFVSVLGPSLPVARLRADIWRSIFTRDMRRYERALHRSMRDIPTLILGPSGTGKELVARAIGASQLRPFDKKTRTFVGAAEPLSVNLSALSPTLIESELFGHKKGAFTGAVEDRVGWLEACAEGGVVFLDEIGELDPLIQVKLLRVLQTRDFARIGETTARPFLGKIVAATNRDLAKEMAAGRFRDDLYYRLCADIVTTPSLAERIAADAGEARTLVTFLVRRLITEPVAMQAAADEVIDFIDREMPPSYPWPGNVRELEQCVRNVLIRGVYQPASSGGASPLQAMLDAGELTADELLRHYCTRVYARTGNYEETARRLDIDRRTVKSRIDADLLAALQKGRTR